MSAWWLLLALLVGMGIGVVASILFALNIAARLAEGEL